MPKHPISLKVHAAITAGLIVTAGAGYIAGQIRPAGPRPSNDRAAQPDRHLLQSRPAVTHRPASDYGLGPNHASRLRRYPPGGPGVRTPLDLWHYAGKGDNSWGSAVLPMPFPAWLDMHRVQ